MKLERANSTCYHGYNYNTHINPIPLEQKLVPILHDRGL